MTNTIDIPACNTADPAQLAAWYAGFAFSETYRKVVLAQCKELVRAKYTAGDAKITEARLDDLARVHDVYLTYLLTNLEGRVLYERDVLATRGMT